MAEGYVKILSSILDSSIWAEPDDVVRVWMTMLAMADRDGYVGAAPSGIAYRTRTVSVERVRELLQKFESPDPDSRTDDFEGRRIQKVDRGYLILNYKKIRDMHGEESQKAAKRKWWNEHRKGQARTEKPPEHHNSPLESSALAESSNSSSHGSVVAYGSGSSESDARDSTAIDRPANQNVPTRRARSTDDLRTCPIEQLANKCRANPYDAGMAGIGERPELERINRAWSESVGLKARPLGAYSEKNRGLIALLEAFETTSESDLLRACKQAGRDDWCTGRKGTERDPARKRDVGCMSQTVIRRLLDACEDDEPRRIHPTLQKVLDEELARRNAVK